VNSRQRVLTTLKHWEPDRVPFDLGGMDCTGIMGVAYNKLKAYLGISSGRTRIYDLGQQLAEPEIELLEKVGADVLLVLISKSKKWKKSELPDGSPCEVPEDFNPEVLPNGSQVLRNNTGRIIAKMPKDGNYFDGVYHPLQNTNAIEELKKNSFLTMQLKEIIDKEVLDDLYRRVKNLYEKTDYALVLNSAGGVYEWAQDLRGWGNFMMDLAANPEFAGYLLDKLVEINIKRLEQILPLVEGYIQVIQVGDDLGIQDGPQISLSLYREVVKPRHKRLYQYIKEHTSAYLFLHTCGSVYEFIPDIIEMGVDILNPVQVSAKGMDTKKLKKSLAKI